MFKTVFNECARWVPVLWLLLAGVPAVALTQDEIYSRMEEVSEAFDEETTQTAMQMAEQLLKDIKPLKPDEELSEEEWDLLTYQMNAGIYLSDRMFWAAFEDFPKFGSPDKYAHMHLAAAKFIYENDLDNSQVYDDDVVHLGLTIGYSKEEDGDNSGALKWYELTKEFVDLAIEDQGELPGLLWLRGETLDYATNLQYDSISPKDFPSLTRELFDLMIRGIASQAENPDTIQSTAERLSELGLWLLGVEGMTWEELDTYVTKLERSGKPELYPVLATLYQLKSEWAWNYRTLEEARYNAQKVIEFLGSGPEANYDKIYVLSALAGIVADLGRFEDVQQIVDRMEQIAKQSTFDEKEEYIVQATLLDTRAVISNCQRDRALNLKQNRQIIELPGFQIEDTDHYWQRCGSLSMLASLEIDRKQAARHLKELEKIQDAVAALDADITVDHNTTTVQNMLMLSRAYVLNYFWFDEPLALDLPNRSEIEIEDWYLWDLYTLLEKAWLEGDRLTMSEALEELMRRGTSERPLDTYLWWLTQDYATN